MAEIKRVGVIGAGQMGSGIAHVCALAGYEVLLNDIARSRLDESLKVIDHNMSRLLPEDGVDRAREAPPGFFLRRETGAA